MSPGNPDTPDRLVDAVRRCVITRDLFTAGDFVLAAVSGGADSMTLLSVLHRLSGSMRFTLAAAHFNHRIRASAGDELEHVRRAAESLGIPFHWGEEDVPAIAKQMGDSLEEAARKRRYVFLHAKAAEIGAGRIATGHTRTDHIETVLMRIVRGTGLRGLAGIPVRRGAVVRPLIEIEHEDTVSYCRSRGIAYVDDPSNKDTRFFRNRVRTELLPLIESEYHPGVRENLARLADIARTALENVRQRTRPLIAENLARAGEDRWELATRGFRRLDAFELSVLFGDIFAEEMLCDMDFTRVHYEELARLVLESGSSGKMVSLPGMTARKEHGRIVFERYRPGVSPFATAAMEPAGFPAELDVPGVTEARGVRVSTSVADASEVDPSRFGSRPFSRSTPPHSAAQGRSRRLGGDPTPQVPNREDEAYFDRETVTPPLVVRFPKPGDRMRPFGMSGTKKLSDIFIDKKIPSGERPTTLVIADAHDILWVVGIATSEKCRVREETREILRIRVEQTGEDSCSG
jgi:tRNA(Ile)-lysidine synthase